jgi:hypothetical protein
MFRTRLPSIFITCHKMQRLPRNLHVVTTWRSPRIVHGICPWMKVKILFAYVSFSFDYIVLYVFKLFVNLVYISYVIIWYYNVLYFITFFNRGTYMHLISPMCPCWFLGRATHPSRRSYMMLYVYNSSCLGAYISQLKAARMFPLHCLLVSDRHCFPTCLCWDIRPKLITFLPPRKSKSHESRIGKAAASSSWKARP